MASKLANKNRKPHHPFQRTLVSALVMGASLASAQVTISPSPNPVGGTVNVSEYTTTGPTGFENKGTTNVLTNGILTNTGAGVPLKNQTDAVLNVQGTGYLENFNGALLSNQGALNVSNVPFNSGTPFGLDNFGAGTQLINQTGGQLTSTGASFIADAAMMGASITNRNGAAIVNTDLGSVLSNQSGSIVAINSNATLTNLNGALLENRGANARGDLATIYVTGGTLTNTGTSSTFNNGTGGVSPGLDGRVNIFGNGVVYNQEGATLNNKAGGLIAVGQQYSTGFLTNADAGSTLNNQSGGIIDVSGQGYLQNRAGAQLVNEGAVMIRANVSLGEMGGLDNYGAGTKLINRGVLVGDNSSVANPLPVADNITIRNGAELINTGAGALLSNRDGSRMLITSLGVLTNEAGAMFENKGVRAANAVNYAATINVSGGTLTNTGPGSTFNNGSGGASGNVDGLVNIVGSGVISNQSGASLNNRAGGSIQVGHSSGANGFLVNSGTDADGKSSTLTNQKGGLINVALEGGSLQNFNQGRLVNEGLLMVRSSSNFAQAWTGLDNFGAGTQLINQNGGLIVSNRSTVPNTFPGANITNRNGASIVNTGAGSLLSNQDGSILSMASSATLTNQSGATLENRGLGLNAARATMDIHSNARLTNTGTGSTFNNGTGTTGSGAWDAQVRLSGGIVSNEAGATLNNRAGGFIVVGDPLVSSSGSLVNTGAGTTLNNNKGGLIDVSGQGNLSNGTGAQLVNEGVLLVRATQGMVEGLDNYGAGTKLINQAGGVLISDNLNSPGIAGNISSRNGAEIINTGAGTKLSNLNGSQFTIASNGAVTNENGALLENAGQNSVYSSTITVNSGRLTNTGNGSTFNNGSSDAASGFNGAVLVRGAGAISNEAGATLNNKKGGLIDVSDQSNLSNSAGAQLVNQGVLLVRGGHLINTGTGSALNNSNGARMVVAGGGSLANESGAALNNAASIENNGQLSNSGVFTVTSTGVVSGVGRYVQSAGLTESNGSWSQGLTDIQGGTLRGTGAINGGVHNDGTIQGTGSGLTLTGAVTGAGSYQGTVAFTGSFGPGNSPVLVTADHLVFGTSNHLNMELGGLLRGTQYDAINATAIDLAGQLSLAFLNLGNGLFSAHAGDFFDILQGDLIGDFTSLDYGLAQLESGLYWTHEIVQLGNGLEAYRLLVAQAPAGGNVPEPATLVLVILGLAMMGHRARRRVRKV